MLILLIRVAFQGRMPTFLDQVVTYKQKYGVLLGGWDWGFEEAGMGGRANCHLSPTSVGCGTLKERLVECYEGTNMSLYLYRFILISSSMLVQIYNGILKINQ